MLESYSLENGNLTVCIHADIIKWNDENIKMEIKLMHNKNFDNREPSPVYDDYDDDANPIIPIVPFLHLQCASDAVCIRDSSTETKEKLTVIIGL